MDELDLDQMADNVFDQIQKRKSVTPMKILEKYGNQIDIENKFKFRDINSLEPEPFYNYDDKNISLIATESLPFKSGDYRIKKPIPTGYRISRNGQIVSVQKNELTEDEKKLFNL